MCVVKLNGAWKISDQVKCFEPNQFVFGEIAFNLDKCHKLQMKLDKYHKAPFFFCLWWINRLKQKRLVRDRKWHKFGIARR